MKLKITTLALGALIVSAAVSSALTINPATTAALFTGNQTGQSAINSFLDSQIAGFTSTERYKQNVGGSESGSLAGSYTTTFSNSPNDPSEATITYGSGQVVGPTAYLLVKDGNSNPAWYLFNLTSLGWNGMETLNLTAFWPQQGAISHVSLYGTPSNPPPRDPGNRVPDGGTTLVSLGVALLGLGSMRRLIGSKA